MTPVFDVTTGMACHVSMNDHHCLVLVPPQRTLTCSCLISCGGAFTGSLVHDAPQHGLQSGMHPLLADPYNRSSYSKDPTATCYRGVLRTVSTPVGDTALQRMPSGASSHAACGNK